MDDVKHNVAQRDATKQTDPEVADDPLLNACDVFWTLEAIKKKLLSEVALADPSAELREELSAIQRKLIATLQRIKCALVKNRKGFQEKLKVLKHRAIATDFQDPDILRELVTLLDTDGNWLGDIEGEQSQAFGHSLDERKPWKFNLHNLFGILGG